MEDQNIPATKQDIAAAEQRIDEKIEQLRSEVNHGYRELQERLDDGVTRMLTAFYNVAETHGKELMVLDDRCNPPQPAVNGGEPATRH